MVTDLAGEATLAASVPVSTDRMRPSEIHAPSFAPDGSLAYVRIEAGAVTLVRADKVLVAGEDLYPFRPGWLADGGLLYGSNGNIRRRSTAGTCAVVPFKVRVPVATPSYKIGRAHV